MGNRTVNKWMFTRACNYAKEKTLALSFFDDGTDSPKEATQLVFFKSDTISSHLISWQAVALDYVSKPEMTCIVIGANGEVVEGTAKGFSETVIDDSDDGPANRGVLRDVRRIGDRAYTTGMKRQVYRREVDGTWTRFDKGVVLPLTDDKILGFNSIDGFSEDDIYAVGWQGEIWHCHKGRWKRADSPTNVKLERVICAGDSNVYAVGQKGTIIRGRDHRWKVITQGDVEEQFWGAAWYWDRLWLATSSAVYVLTDQNDLQKAELVKGDKEITCGWLNAGFDTMWSVGAKHLFKTSDGLRWDPIVIT